MTRIKTWMSILLIGCGAALLLVLFVPMWRIDLVAPQYPEGLKLLIYPHKLGGDVEIINGLNHYIGMKTLHTSDFTEFTFLPYIISFFALMFILTGIIARKKMLYTLAVLFVAFGLLAMYDFWRWEYNYGHNLNPDAAIVVPGMAYQPPLIGFKQLLNFGAYSMPDTGGWIFVAVGFVLVSLALITRFKSVPDKMAHRSLVFLLVFSAVNFCSCKSGPEPIIAGTDHCYFCKMTITDLRFSTELLTDKGRIFKFDDIHCMLSYVKADGNETHAKTDFFVADFSSDHALLNASSGFYLQSPALRSPMGGNIAAFRIKDSLLTAHKFFPGEIVNWETLKSKH